MSQKYNSLNLWYPHKHFTWRNKSAIIVKIGIANAAITIPIQLSFNSCQEILGGHNIRPMSISEAIACKAKYA
jgi:hypothetical protein